MRDAVIVMVHGFTELMQRTFNCSEIQNTTSSKIFHVDTCIWTVFYSVLSYNQSWNTSGFWPTLYSTLSLRSRTLYLCLADYIFSVQYRKLKIEQKVALSFGTHRL